MVSYMCYNKQKHEHNMIVYDYDTWDDFLHDLTMAWYSGNVILKSSLHLFDK